MTMTKILLVEADKALRAIYGVRLLAEGYDIVSAGDGEEALTVAIREKPALIISDVMMPKISGFEMLDLLRNNEATKGIKIIMMTALSGDQHRERSESLGADRYLIKSQIGIEDVVNTVHEILGDRDAPAAQPATVAPAPDAVAPAPQPVAPTTPLPNQSPVNLPAATAPSTVAGVPAPTLPATPPSVPVITTTDVPAKPAPAPAPIVAQTPAPAPPTAAVTSITDTPTAPPPPANIPDLPPLPPPGATPPAQDNTPIPAPVAAPAPPTDNVPSFQPQNDASDDSSQEGAPATLAVDLTQSSQRTGVRVIQPTGESLNPAVDMNNLLANEEAKDIMSQPVSPDFQSQVAAEPAQPSATGTPEIQIDSSGAINIDNLPAAPPVDSTATFPNQS